MLKKTQSEVWRVDGPEVTAQPVDRTVPPHTGDLVDDRVHCGTGFAELGPGHAPHVVDGQPARRGGHGHEPLRGEVTQIERARALPYCGQDPGAGHHAHGAAVAAGRDREHDVDAGETAADHDDMIVVGEGPQGRGQRIGFRQEPRGAAQPAHVLGPTGSDRENDVVEAPLAAVARAQQNLVRHAASRGDGFAEDAHTPAPAAQLTESGTGRVLQVRTVEGPGGEICGRAEVRVLARRRGAGSCGEPAPEVCAVSLAHRHVLGGGVDPEDLRVHLIGAPPPHMGRRLEDDELTRQAVRPGQGVHKADCSRTASDDTDGDTTGHAISHLPAEARNSSVGVLDHQDGLEPVSGVELGQRVRDMALDCGG